MAAAGLLDSFFPEPWGSPSPTPPFSQIGHCPTYSELPAFCPEERALPGWAAEAYLLSVPLARLSVVPQGMGHLSNVVV